MRVALGQITASSEKECNLERMAAMTADAVAEGADLLLFPELAMADVHSASQAAEAAEPLDGPFASALSSLAVTHHIAILAGMIETILDSSDTYNTLVAFGPDGDLIGAYRKIHLYDAFGYRESAVFRPGTGDTLPFTLGDITFGVQICYDIRFPEMSRRLVEEGATCLLVPTAWVQGPLKESQWELLLRARAVENTVYVAGSGLTGPGYCGNSTLVDPMGVPTARLGESPGLVYSEVCAERVAAVRQMNPSLDNRRPEIYDRWQRQPARM